MAIERAVQFDAGEGLAGIVTEPDGRSPATALVVLNAGVVHRVGPNRLSVYAARMLAAEGWLAARFDLSGLGDSPVRRDALPFEAAAVAETRAVLSRLEADYGVRRFVLMGLCSGAVVSFRAAVADERVVGAVLIDPQGFGSDPAWNAEVLSRGRARRFLRKALSPRSWRRALTGQSDYRLAARVAVERATALAGGRGRVAEVGQRLQTGFESLESRGVRLLLTCSAGDYAMDYLEAILGAGLRRLGPPHLQLEMLPAGDHSLTMRVSQEAFLTAVRGWSRTLAPGARAAAHVQPERARTAIAVAAPVLERGE